jgi:dethiobiotin synthetase
MMHRIYFVSGIDTSVGKTIATGMMARYLHQKGVRVATVKMVQTGCHDFSEDLDMHRQLMGVPALPEDAQKLTFPQTFDFPSSPLLAATLEHRVVDTQKITDAVNAVAANYEITFAEGAGGLMVPLTESLLTVDLAAQNHWPCILVCNGKLGSLNHALLSLEALENRHIPLAGVVYNYYHDADPLIDNDTPAMIQKHLDTHFPGSRVVRLGKVDPTTPEKTPLPDFAPIFR